MTTLVAVSIFAAYTAVALSPKYIGLFGFLPIALGVKELFALRKPLSPLVTDRAPEKARHASVALVAAVTIVNGADNIGIYTPIFVVRTGTDIAIMAAVFGLMTAAWCVLAHKLVIHPGLGSVIRKCARWLLPFVLIGIGLAVLCNAGQPRHQ